MDNNMPDEFYHDIFGLNLSDQEMQLLVEEVFEDLMSKFNLTGRNKIRSRLVEIVDQVGLVDTDTISFTYTSEINIGYIRAKVGRVRIKNRGGNGLISRICRTFKK